MIERDAYEVLNVHPGAHQLVVKAAYRVLAAIYHPDREASDAATHRMAELNVAYDKVRTLDRREVYDRERERREQPPAAVVTPYQVQKPLPPPADGGEAGILDFGRYNGWTIRSLAREDPDYLRWLRRHSSGIRYRRAIEVALRESAGPTASERIRGGRQR
jgi:curved DNA-binding protein CbpA